MTSGPLLVCVPNFSTADADTVGRILAATQGVHVLDASSDIDHGRTVITMAGDPGSLRQSILSMSRLAIAEIDLSSHTGVHPRTGAVDVVPFVPVAGTGMDEAVAAAKATAAALREAGIAVEMYAQACDPPRTLPLVRRLIREGGASGTHGAQASAGVTMVGARGPLVAFNVDLGTDQLDLARKIAREVRQEHIRALGFALASRKIAQVSMNLVAPDLLTMPQAFSLVRKGALNLDVEVIGSECVGLATRASTGGEKYSSYGLPRSPKILEDLIEAIR